MNRGRGILAAICATAAICSGCAVRTYTVYKDRVDQDLSAGNRGFIGGAPPAVGTTEPQKTERKVIEVEIPMLRYRKKQPAQKPAGSGGTAVSSGQGPGVIEYTVAAPSGPAAVVEYTVLTNDTLQKISKKFYGTAKKWKTIFDANKEKLKSPDRIRPGQVLQVPLEADAAPVGEKPFEPAENLK
ncbi:MAG: LysM peptidoglycan-binding domain-containing protein [Candidatus Omnitrophica bacterium]|nr:LysM peptidoglycan-binding domain-containing protein [Candidatus Omnitrophota bacterium]